MGSIAKHTDLSWEVPGLRAHVDVPLEDTESQVLGHGTSSGIGSAWMQARNLGSWDDGNEQPGLEDF